MIKAIIFDFDGVIHDTLDVAYKIAKEVHPGMTMTEYKDMFDGNVYSHIKSTGASSIKFLEIQTERYKFLKIEREIKKELEQLKEKYELHIISSNSEKILNRYFENNDITHIFNEVLGVETHKSKHEKFLMLLKKHNLKKEESIFVTDTLGDIIEANKVGIKTIAVDFGFHERHRLEKGNPAMIMSHFKELKTAIKNISK